MICQGRRDIAAASGKEPAASRPSEEATRELLAFMDDLNLDPAEVHQLVSRLVSDVLREHGDEWREVFGNTLRSRVRDLA